VSCWSGRVHQRARGSIISAASIVFLHGVQERYYPRLYPSGFLHARDTFELQVVFTALLKTIYLHTHFSRNAYLNPYWCGAGHEPNQPTQVRA